MTTQLQLPEVPPAPTFRTEVDVIDGRWIAYRRQDATFEAEKIGSSKERGVGLAQVLTKAVERGDSLTILVRSGNNSAVFSANGRPAH